MESGLSPAAGATLLTSDSINTHRSHCHDTWAELDATVIVDKDPSAEPTQGKHRGELAGKIMHSVFTNS